MTVEFETERLRMRDMRPEDVEPHIAMMQNEATSRFLSPDGTVAARPELWRQAASYLGHWTIRGFGFFSVIEKESGEWIGRVGPWMPEGWPGLEVGWSIVADRWGRGYAPEAAIGAVRWTFAAFPDLARIISVIEPTNAPSQAVARKIGEQNTGESFQFGAHRLEVWAAPREAWLARFGPAPSS